MLWSDAVYAVTWEKLEWNDHERPYAHAVGGGTKWSVQVYIDRFVPIGSEPAENCRLFFYEVNSSTWRRWNARDQRWQRLDSVPAIDPTWRFAGVGTRDVINNKNSASAVRALFQASYLSLPDCRGGRSGKGSGSQIPAVATPACDLEVERAAACQIFKYVSGVLNKAFEESDLSKYKDDLAVWSVEPHSFHSACDALAGAIDAGAVPPQGIEVLGRLADRLLEHGVLDSARLAQSLVKLLPV